MSVLQTTNVSGLKVLAFVNPVLSGSTLWLNFSFDTSGTVTSVADNLNGAWALAIGNTNTTNSERNELWYRHGSVSGSCTVTITGSASIGMGLSIAEVASGLQNLAPDKVAAVFGTGTAAASGAVTTTADGEYLMCGLQEFGTTILALNGFSLITENQVEAAMLDRVQVAQGSIDFAVTLNASANWASSMATFKTTPTTTAFLRRGRPFPFKPGSSQFDKTRRRM